MKIDYNYISLGYDLFEYIYKLDICFSSPEPKPQVCFPDLISFCLSSIQSWHRASLSVFFIKTKDQTFVKMEIIIKCKKKKECVFFFCFFFSMLKLKHVFTKIFQIYLWRTAMLQYLTLLTSIYKQTSISAWLSVLKTTKLGPISSAHEKFN